MSDYRHDIEKYLKGELSPAERNALERKALHDPFLADALEGAEQIKAEDFSSDIASLNKQITDKKLVSVWMWPARVAAGLVLIAASAFIILTVLQSEPEKELAFESKQTPSPIVSADSVSVPTEALSSSRLSRQPEAGPSSSDKDLATRSTPLKLESKPLQSKAEESEALKNEPLVEAIAADAKVAAAEQAKDEAKVKADEIVATEALALNKAVEEKKESIRAKAVTSDDAAERKLSLSSVKKKATAKDAAPASGAVHRSADYVSSDLISGQVTSAEDGTPLPGVNIMIKGTNNGTITDEQGNYQIEVDKEKTLVYNFIGLQSKEIPVKDQRDVNVQMAQDASQLSEVVVTGGLTVQQRELSIPPSTFEIAHPENGMRAFKEYLQNGVHYPKQAVDNKTEGRVTVEFTIEIDGTLTNFSILKGIGSGCDEELIRLIKEGPKWIPTKREGEPLQDKAKVRLKFELPK